tara:strand:- start:6130 stop:6405 length:276 start_codon:yes stop_codon:yes gene_type:complete
MDDSDEGTEKIHYICQTYVEAKGRGGQASLKVDKLLQYTTAAQAEDRAERESRNGSCVGADAYMISEDPSSGEVSAPTFLARFGRVPDDEE